jgi:predicted RNA-binding Zn-ribbon protein involved in translation (DUF1610 family)
MTTSKTVGEVGFQTGRVPFACPNDGTICVVIGGASYEFRCPNCGSQWNRGDAAPYTEGIETVPVANVFIMQAPDSSDANPDAPDRD